jgi:microcystin-dependent protein
MADQFLAEIRVFPFSFAPQGWALCNGQLLPINQNTALFSLLGTTYGGDGRTTFALPNLQGAAPLHVGGSAGPGLTLHTLGETGGAETVTLALAQLPAHTHAVAAASANDISTASATPGPTTVFGASQARATSTGYVTVGAQAASAISGAAVAATGGSQPHNNMAPYLVFNFCIALQGIFPARN